MWTKSFVVLIAGLIGGGCGFKPSGNPFDPITGQGGSGGSGNTGGSGGTWPGRGGNGGGPPGSDGGFQTGAGGNTTVSNPDSNCGVVEKPVTRLPPDILIVLDASGSMNNSVTNQNCNNGCGANSKWAATIPAINQVVAQTEATVNWGLKFFADTDTECGVSPNTVAIEVAPNNAAAIAAAIAGRTDPNGNVVAGSSTPTRRAEDAAVTYLSAVTDQNPKFILLATDGQPNCAGTMGNNMTADNQGSIDAVARAFAAGFPTFVVGIATSGGNADTALNGMANAGGFARMAATPAYYPVSTSAELAAALSTLVGVAASCTFPVPEPPGARTSRDFITVWVNGVKTEISATDGWQYGPGGNSSVVINGPMCDQILAGTTTDVKIIFDCIVM